MPIIPMMQGAGLVGVKLEGTPLWTAARKLSPATRALC